MRKRILFKEEEIAREIILLIENARLKEGDRLPAERQLAEKFGVQRDTVRCALDFLLNKGVIIKRPRKGYYVAPKRIELNLKDFSSIKREIERIGHRSKSILLNYEVVSMDRRLAETTHMQEGTLCYQVLRIRYDIERPISLERSYILIEHVPDLSRDDLEKRTLASLLKQKYGITLVSAFQRITQVYGGDMEAELLRIRKNEPLVRYEGLIYDRKDRLIEYFDNVMLPYSLEFHIRDYA